MRKTTEAQIIMNALVNVAVAIATNLPNGRGTGYQAWWRCSRTRWTVISGQNVTKAVGSITNFVDVQDVKGSGSLNSTYLLKMNWCAVSFLNGSKQCLILQVEGDKNRIIPFKHVHPWWRGAQEAGWKSNYDINKQVLQYTMTWCRNNGSIYAERYDVITANNDLAPED